MSSLTDYGHDLAEIYIGALGACVERRLPEQLAVQTAYTSVLAYMATVKPQPPIRMTVSVEKSAEKKPDEKKEKGDKANE